MKLEKLREVVNRQTRHTRWTALENFSEVTAISTIMNHIDALLSVVEAAKLVTEQRKLTEYRALSEALTKLEAVE